MAQAPAEPMKIYLAVLLLCIACSAYARELTNDEKNAVQRAIGELLRDPFSAHFKWVDFNDKYGRYCAYVNAKTLYGAYVGFVKFRVFIIQKNQNKTGKAEVVFPQLSDTDSTSDDSKVIESMCSEAGY